MRFATRTARFYSVEVADLGEATQVIKGLLGDCFKGVAFWLSGGTFQLLPVCDCYLPIFTARRKSILSAATASQHELKLQRSR